MTAKNPYTLNTKYTADTNKQKQQNVVFHKAETFMSPYKLNTNSIRLYDALSPASSYYLYGSLLYMEYAQTTPGTITTVFIQLRLSSNSKNIFKIHKSTTGGWTNAGFLLICEQPLSTVGTRRRLVTMVIKSGIRRTVLCR